MTWPTSFVTFQCSLFSRRWYSPFYILYYKTSHNMDHFLSMLQRRWFSCLFNALFIFIFFFWLKLHIFYCYTYYIIKTQFVEFDNFYISRIYIYMRIELYANVDSIGKILLHTVCLMVFNATFNNISVTSISWRSVFSSPGPKVQVNYCLHLSSVVCRLSSVVCRL
jgi:hypothetical protein